jgi:molybdate/tungstate transport system substrate-binding protein
MQPSRLAALAATALAIAGCGSSAAGDAAGRGPVSVLYAGSLEKVMDTRIGPAFTQATGYTLNGYPAGSKDLANEIRGRVRQGDVFMSASPEVNRLLEGRANGGWLSSFTAFATTSLVLGYNPHSSFAAQLRRRPWYRVIARPGFRLGFTDPALDPKGALTVAALRRAAAAEHEPGLRRLTTDTADVFPEQDLVGRLESGQLDAGFFYTVEARAAGIPSVSLAPVAEHATYTVALLNRAPDPAGARAFVRFLLGARGAAILRAAGLTVRR